MQPDSQPQLPNPSLDYLNQIAAPVPQKTMNPMVLWGAIAGVLLLTIVVFFALLSSGTSNADRMTTLAAQLTNLQSVTAIAPDNLQSSELRALNSNLSVALASANQDSGAAVAATGATTSEKDERVLAVVSEIETMKNKLEDARLNVVYDRTYAREITYYLKTLHAEMDELYQATNKDVVREFLRATDDNLQPFIQDFSEYNGS